MSASNYVHLDVDEISVVTDKALLLVIDGESVWMPLSQVADAGDYKKGMKNCTVSVTEWIAREKGIEVD